MTSSGKLSRVHVTPTKRIFWGPVLTSSSLVDVISRFSRPWYTCGLMTVCRENSGAGLLRAETTEHNNVSLLSRLISPKHCVRKSHQYFLPKPTLLRNFSIVTHVSRNIQNTLKFLYCEGKQWRIFKYYTQHLVSAHVWYGMVFPVFMFENCWMTAIQRGWNI